MEVSCSFPVPLPPDATGRGTVQVVLPEERLRMGEGALSTHLYGHAGCGFRSKCTHSPFLLVIMSIFRFSMRSPFTLSLTGGHTFLSPLLGHRASLFIPTGQHALPLLPPGQHVYLIPQSSYISSSSPRFKVLFLSPQVIMPCPLFPSLGHSYTSYFPHGSYHLSLLPRDSYSLPLSLSPRANSPFLPSLHPTTLYFIHPFLPLPLTITGQAPTSPPLQSPTLFPILSTSHIHPFSTHLPLLYNPPSTPPSSPLTLSTPFTSSHLPLLPHLLLAPSPANILPLLHSLPPPTPFHQLPPSSPPSLRFSLLPPSSSRLPLPPSTFPPIPPSSATNPSHTPSPPPLLPLSLLPFLAHALALTDGRGRNAPLIKQPRQTPTPKRHIKNGRELSLPPPIPLCIQQRYGA
ncbi:hypothetical protein C7M84_013452 [Penaeus vannamei]|uniref:Uncharacterized protein n=1 Tax=Penaeus vannamei TaxID=6689 RepID=A0A423SVY2_PENVA|nr:hypothetical protein C7M84_013452 [Penaeus vannamei]